MISEKLTQKIINHCNSLLLRHPRNINPTMTCAQALNCEGSGVLLQMLRHDQLWHSGKERLGRQVLAAEVDNCAKLREAPRGINRRAVDMHVGPWT